MFMGQIASAAAPAKQPLTREFKSAPLTRFAQVSSRSLEKREPSQTSIEAPVTAAPQTPAQAPIAPPSPEHLALDDAPISLDVLRRALPQRFASLGA